MDEDAADTMKYTNHRSHDQRKTEEKKILLIAGYTVAAILLLAGVAIITRFSLTGLDGLNTLIIYVACSGGLGALTFSMYGYTKHQKQGTFDTRYFWWYIFRPVMGIIYGLFSFFFVAGGLMTLSGIDPATISQSLYSTKAFMFYCALAFLAGYAERAFTVQLNELAEAVFKKPKEDAPHPGRTSPPSENPPAKPPESGGD